MGELAHAGDTLTFSIQHPDLSSSLVAPVSARVAIFQELKCVMDVCRIVTELVEEKPRMKRSRKRPRNSSTDVREEASDETYRSLAPGDQRAINDFIAMLGDKKEKTVKAPPDTVKRKEVKVKQPLQNFESLHDAIEAALNLLLLGGSRKTPGFRTNKEGSSFAGMSRLVPGVFHVPGLKVGFVCPPLRFQS